MKQTKVLIFDNHQKTSTEALLVEDVPLEMIEKANVEWIRIRQQYRDRCRQQGLPYPEHSHWNWEDKAKRSEMSGAFQTRFGIICQDEIQGLMLVEQKTEFAKLPPDKGEPLLYVRYLEAAPQNIESYTSPRKFLGVGRLFLRVAVDFSVEIGCVGRVGLHALPQAEEFYRANGMMELERDPAHDNLRYFEFTSKLAQEYQKRK
jgi:hypothetical protein